MYLPGFYHKYTDDLSVRYQTLRINVQRAGCLHLHTQKFLINFCVCRCRQPVTA